jgi:hypothetical protein
MKETKYISQRVVKGNRVIGWLVAAPHNYDTLTIQIGWSKVNYKAGDKYDAVRGKAIAFGRATKSEIVPAPPYQLTKAIKSFRERAHKYFKGTQFTQ